MKKLSHGCTLDCPDCCKLNIYVENNEIVKIEGDKDHPYTKGFMCKKGQAHLSRLNHPKRIYTPLLKRDGSWHEISFDEALTLMSSKLKTYKEEYGPTSVLYYEQYGNGTILKSIGEIFFNFYGGASRQKGGPCWSAGIKAQKLDFGDSKSHSLEDMMNSKTIIVWGKNPAVTSIHTMQIIRKAIRQGIKVIVIDPIETETAKAATEYIRINPGADIYLALAMGKIIIESELYDIDFIKKYVNGFDEYRKLLLELDMELLINKIGITKEVLYALVKDYTKKNSTILLGYGLQKYKNGGNTIRAIDALAVITGQIGVAGGGVNYANKVFPKVLNGDPYNSSKNVNDRFFFVSKMGKFINESLDNGNVPVKMAVITKSNLLNQLPNLNELKEAFNKIEFKVCFDMFMTDTAEECDLFIPTTSTLESEDLLYSSMMNPYLTYNERIVKPKEELMDEYVFFRELAREMGIEDYPYVEKREYLNEIIKPLKAYNGEISLEYLKNNYFTLHNPIPWDDYKFTTESGKIEISVDKEVLKEDDKRISEFRLITNHSRDTLFSQHMMDIDDIAKAYINFEVAKTLDIQENEIVLLRSQNGEIEVEMKIDDSIHRDVVMMYVGWWKKSGNPNYITDNEISDIGGQVAYNETMIEIIKINR